MDNISNQSESVLVTEATVEDSTFIDKIRTLGRIVFAACYNVLHAEHELQYPGNISEEKWKDQYFRAWNPSLQKLEARQKQAVDTTRERFQSVLGRLKNVSIGDNRGAGMNVVQEEVESAFKETVAFKQELFVQRVLSRMVSQIAANSPARKKIQKKVLSGSYEKDLRNRLRQKEDTRKSSLQKRVEEYQHGAVEKKGRELRFFETVQDLRNFKTEEQENI